jgi:hypothetical protein
MFKDIDPETAAAIDTLIDTFGGGDNISFIKFAALVQSLDKQSKAGDTAATMCLAPIAQVARLIRLSGRV